MPAVKGRDVIEGDEIFTGCVRGCEQVGDIVVGQVVQYEQSGALVDIGGKSSAFLAPPEASMQRVDDLEDFMMIGDHREFQVFVCPRILILIFLIFIQICSHFNLPLL